MKGAQDTRRLSWRRWAVVVVLFVACSLSIAGGVVNLSAEDTALQDGNSSRCDIKDSHVQRFAKKKKGKKKKGMKKKKHKKKKKRDCKDGGKYRKNTLQMIDEVSFAGLFKDHKGQTKYEASDVIIVDDMAYAVCDSSWAIYKFSTSLEHFGRDNVQIGDPFRMDEVSGYEALFYNDGIFYAVRESVEISADERHRRADEASYHAIIEELSLHDDDYEVVSACPCEYEFEGDSKGFEGALAVHDLNNELVILGLCEGNYCSEEYKDEAGNGRVIAMRKVVENDGACTWATIREIEIPSSADFTDYSAIAMDEQGRVAITSQEDSQLWIAQMVGRQSDGLWNIEKIEFDDTDAKVYDFPKNDNCKTIYCNVEGIQWMEDNMLLAVSDKMKSKGKQHFRCFEKDQSVHAFFLPV